MPKTLSQKSSFRLLLWGLLLVPFATVADSVLDAVLFTVGTIQEQLLTPSYHELASRFLFSTFILAAIYLGMHYLANTAQKEGSLLRRNRDQSLARQNIEENHHDTSQQLRNTAAELQSSLELLKNQCGKELDEKAQFFLEGVSRTSDKLQEQMNISLALNEIPSGEPHRERVKLDKLALEVIDELKIKQLDRQVEFKVQPWATGWCDPKMLRLVIYNLFTNAIAFIPPSRQGLIEFGMFNRNGQQVLFVRDNGTGFNDAQAKRLFNAFRDSAQDPDLPSDTTRLAITRSIIHRHDGQIWAEGAEGAGGTFFFTYYSS